MKNLLLFFAFFTIAACNVEEPISEPMILSDQSLVINEEEFGVVTTYSYDESLNITLEGNMLTILSTGAIDEDYIELVFDIEKIMDNEVTPERLKLTSVDLGPGTNCPSHLCDQFRLFFTASDFTAFGIFEGTLIGNDSQNPEAPQYTGSFMLQID